MTHSPSLRSQLPLALRAAYLAMHRRTEAAVEQLGVTAEQFVLLAALARGEALTQRALARRMSSDPSTVGAMLMPLDKVSAALDPPPAPAGSPTSSLSELATP